MAGNLEINGEEGSGRVEVVGCVVNLGGENGVQSEQYSKEVAAEIVVVEESASSSTDIATSENGKHKRHLIQMDCHPSYATL